MTTEKIKNLDNIGVDYLKSLLPISLYKKFTEHKINTLKEILEIPEDEFKIRLNVRSKLLKQFVNLKKDILAKPQKYINCYLANKEIVLPISEEPGLNILQIYQSILLDYKKKHPKERDVEILFWRYGIDRESDNFDNISSHYGFTRERARQIQEEEKNNIRMLLNGSVIEKPFCTCKQKYVNQFEDLQNIIYFNEIHTFSTLVKNIEKKLSINTSFLAENYFNLLLAIYGYDKLNFSENIVYYSKKKIDSKNLRELLRIIINVLNNNIFPLESLRVTNKVKEVLKWKNLQNELVESILLQLSEVEIIRKGNKNYFQLRLDLLSSAGHMGLRILKELGIPTRSGDITDIINKKLLPFGIKKKVTQDSVKIFFSKSQLAVANGKTGYWSLKEWGIDSGTLDVLISNVLKEKNKPMSIEEIYNQTVGKRPEIKCASLRSIVGMHQNKFSRLRNGKIILKKWDNKYKTEILKKSEYAQTKYDDLKIMKEMISLYELNETNKLLTNYVREELKNKGVFFKNSTFNMKMNKYPIFERAKKNSHFLLLKKNYESILYKSTSNNANSSLNRIKNSAISILGEHNNKLKLSKIVNMLVEKYGYSKSSTYTVLRNKKVFYRETLNKKIYVTLIDNT